jgi:hypothetical protein
MVYKSIERQQKNVSKGLESYSVKSVGLIGPCIAAVFDIMRIAPKRKPGFQTSVFKSGNSYDDVGTCELIVNSVSSTDRSCTFIPSVINGQQSR